jgi:hypothetical protein
VQRGAHDRASPNFMGLASLALSTGVFCDFLYSILLLNTILGLDFLGLALYPGRRCNYKVGAQVDTSYGCKELPSKSSTDKCAANMAWRLGEAGVGLVRTVALHDRSSTSYQIF